MYVLHNIFYLHTLVSKCKYEIVWVQRRERMGNEKLKEIAPSKLSSKIDLVVDYETQLHIFSKSFLFIQVLFFYNYGHFIFDRRKVPLPNTGWLSSKIVYKVLGSMLIQYVVINAYMNQNRKFRLTVDKNCLHSF